MNFIEEILSVFHCKFVSVTNQAVGSRDRFGSPYRTYCPLADESGTKGAARLQYGAGGSGYQCRCSFRRGFVNIRVLSLATED